MLPALGSRIRLRETIGPFERRTSEQANGCTGQYHGMEWNGTEWQECYKISAFTVSARYSFTQTDSSTTPRCTLLLSVSFVLDVRCHRRHNVTARPLAVFKIVFMRSIYRHFIVNRDRSFSGIVLDHLFLFLEIDDNPRYNHSYLISDICARWYSYGNAAVISRLRF